jgi:hypothetical protein
MTDEQEVKQAQTEARQATFKTMFPVLTDIRAEAFNYVKDYVERKHVPYYNVLSYKVYDYTDEPQIEYDFQFVISGNLHFDIASFIRLNKDEDVVYMVCVNMNFNKGKDLDFDGNIMIHTGDVSNYVNSIKDACDSCFKKYLELHEHFKDTFF